jgi:CheY-like chemotaxis protein
MTEMPKVIVMEDESLVRALMVDMLTDIGFFPLEAGTVQQAKDIITEFGDQIRGIVADNDLFGKHEGWAYADVLVRQGIPAIITSGNPKPEDRRQYIHIPFLSKPFTTDSLHKLAQKTFKPERPAGGGGTGFSGAMLGCRAA